MSGRLFDVCVVGGGTVGLVAAVALQRKGLDVLVLEAGDGLRYDGSSSTEHVGVREGWATGLGGTSQKWGGQLWEWEAADFRGTAGEPWPISPEEIQRYYARAYEVLRLGKSSRPPFPRRWRRGGIDGTRTRYSTWLRWNRRNFARVLGPELRRGPAQVMSGLVVTAIKEAADRTVTIRGVADDGGEHEFRSRSVVLAAGTLGNVRLLSASPDLCAHPRAVGSGFIDHLSGTYAELELVDRSRFERVLAHRYRGRTLTSTRYVIDDPDRPAERPFAFAHFVVALGADSPFARLRDALRNLQRRRTPAGVVALARGIGAALPDIPRSLFVLVARRRRPVPAGARVMLRVDVEQIRRDDRVLAVAEGSDVARPSAHLTWFVDDAELAEFERFGAEVVRLLQPGAHGLGSARRVPVELEDTIHMMGGTRMGPPVEGGVVDSQCRVHGSDSVFVAGASVFPSGGVANPTLTAISLTLRLTDHLAERLRGHGMSETDVTEKLPITAIVLTKNEERVIGRTCERLARFAQVLVVDSKSSDDTARIAKAAGADVIDFEWDGKYPKKKQWALESPSVRHDWVLFVDADESPSAQLVDELRDRQAEMATGSFAAYDVPLRYFFLGKELKHGYQVTKRALVDRRKVAFPEVDDLAVATMWEVEGHYQPMADGRVGRLDNRLEHDDIDPLFDYFARHNRYSDWEAYLRDNKRARQQVAQSRSRQGSLFDRVPFKPIVFFLYAYIFRRGFRDGAAGFHYAVANSFYHWQTIVKHRELRANVAEPTSGRG